MRLVPLLADLLHHRYASTRVLATEMLLQCCECGARVIEVRAVVAQACAGESGATVTPLDAVDAAASSTGDRCYLHVPLGALAAVTDTDGASRSAWRAALCANVRQRTLTVASRRVCRHTARTSRRGCAHEGLTSCSPCLGQGMKSTCEHGSRARDLSLLPSVRTRGYAVLCGAPRAP